MDEQTNNDGGGEHWSQGFEHASVTPDNSEAFKTSMAKYESEKDAIVGGYNAQKSIGSPFVLPESMDSLPDDATRTKLTDQARSLMGINIPKSVDDLKDFDFKGGLAEGQEPDEALTGLIKDFAVEKGINSADLQKMVEFYNGPMTAFAMERMATNDTAKFEADSKACNDALIADSDFGSQEEVEKQSTLFKRAINAMATKNGLTVEETTEVVDAMVDGGLTKNPKLAKIMLQAFAPMAKEGATETGDGSGSGEKGMTPYQYKKDRYPKSPEADWGNPSDTWENETHAMRKVAGVKV